MKKLLLTLLTVSILLTLGIHSAEESHTFAQGTNDESFHGPCRVSADCPDNHVCMDGRCVQIGERLEDTRFPVGRHLRLDGDEVDREEQQPTEYFMEESPITSLIVRLIEFATMIIGAIAAILIIIAGFMFMLSQGNDQELTKAKDILKFAVMGLAVAFLAYAIVTFVQSIFI